MQGSAAARCDSGLRRSKHGREIPVPARLRLRLAQASDRYTRIAACREEQHQDDQRNCEFQIEWAPAPILRLRLQFRKLFLGVLSIAGIGIQPQRLLQLLPCQELLVRSLHTPCRDGSEAEDCPGELASWASLSASCSESTAE